MMKAGTETGSLINHLYSRIAEIQPEVGMGCTELCWTDRSAGTIVKVTKTQIHVRGCIATRIDKNGISECQEYTYAEDPTAGVSIFRKTKKGWRNNCGSGLLIGRRETYHDYSF